MAFDAEATGAVAGLLTAGAGLATGLANWLTHRRSAAELRESVAHDVAVVQFWAEWLKLQAQTCDGERLEEAKARVRGGLEELPTFPGRAEALARRSPLSNALLLYKPARWRAWAPRAVFYFLVLWSAANLIVVGLEIVEGTVRGDEAIGQAMLSVGVALVFALLALPTRLLALRMERAT